MAELKDLVELIEAWEMDLRYGKPSRKALDRRNGRHFVVHLEAPYLVAAERISRIIPELASRYPSLAPDMFAFDHAKLMCEEGALGDAAKLVGKLRAAMAGAIGTERTQGSPAGSEPKVDGEWLVPMSLKVIAGRIGQTPKKAKALLNPYSLHTTVNRQTWTVRLDTMPVNLRRQLEA